MAARPTFGTLLSALNAAGVKTGSARGFWGGVTPDQDIVVTAWTDHAVEKDRYRISRPRTRHGGLRDVWDLGSIQPGTTVRMILIRQRGDKRPGDPDRVFKDAALMPGRWRVVEVSPVEDEPRTAIIERVPSQSFTQDASASASVPA